MKKETTLLGFLSGAAKYINDTRKEDNNSELATIDDVKKIVNDMVNKTFVDSLNAKSKLPTTEEIGGIKLFFANGTPIVITEREDGEKGSTVTWDGGSMNLTSDYRVFGGRHNDDTLTNTSIKMYGGQVMHIFGGGLHKSHVVKSSIIMTGGIVSNLRGGGAENYIKNCTCGHDTFVPVNGSFDDSFIRVDEANIVITGGTITTLLYGGGFGYSWTGRANIEISGSPVLSGWNIAGGSNGHTGYARITVNGGNIHLLSGINRGTMDTIELIVNGGNIEQLFAGGEIPFVGNKEKPNSNDPSGIFKKCTVEINGGTIGLISNGGNDYLEISDDDTCVVINDFR